MTITDGIEELFLQRIGAADRLDGTSVRQAFVEIVEQLELNLVMCARFHAKGPSKENWRWPSFKLAYTPGHSSEKDLEKQIVRSGQPDWGNQVPTQSGLVSSTAGKHSNIDLVRRNSDRHYTIYELKTVSNSPHKAATQLVVYAAMFVMSVRNYRGVSSKRWSMLMAERLSLRVLAPRAFYDEFRGAPRTLEQALHEGLADLNDLARRPLAMDFAFEALPMGIDHRTPPHLLGPALDQLVRVNEPA